MSASDEGRPASSLSGDLSTSIEDIDRAIEARDHAAALAGLEQVLLREAPDEAALARCEKLLDVRAVTAQAAALLSDGYARLGRKSDEIGMLTRELRLARAPRLNEVKLRLAALRSDFLDDDAGALEILEPLVAKEPAHDEGRRRYLNVCEKLNRLKEAAKVLSRAQRQAQNDGERARIGMDVGLAFLGAADEAHAREAFVGVLALENAGEHALQAAQHLLIEREGLGSATLVRALAAVALHDPSPGERERAATELTELAKKDSIDPRIEAVALKALVGTAREGDALTRLEALYEAAHDRAGIAEVLCLKAEREPDREAARALSLRGTELRAALAGDPSAAIAAWQKHIARYGKTRMECRRLAALLEQARRYRELAEALHEELTLCDPQDRAQLLARIAALSLAELGDPEAALAAAKSSLELDPAQASARRTLEELLDSDAHRPAAAALLEPLYEAEYLTSSQASALLLRILELQADQVTDGRPLAELLVRAGRVIDHGSLTVGEQLKAAARLLTRVASVAPAVVTEWIERVQRAASDPMEAASAFMAALDRAKSGPVTIELTLAAGKALEIAGRTDTAFALYERQFKATPSPALLAPIDALAVATGQSVEQRVDRYTAAIEQAQAPEQRADLLFALGTLQRAELGELPEAIASLECALAEAPQHFAAHEALLEAYTERDDGEAYERELSRGLRFFQGKEREITLTRLAERLIGRGRAAQALPLCRPLLDDPSTSEAALDVIERLCVQTEDVETLRKVLERRVETAADAPARARALERLGEFFDEWMHDTERTSKAWKAAAEQYSQAPEAGLEPQRVYERVLSSSPGDPEAAARLVELYAASGDWSRVPDAYAALVSANVDAERLLELLLSLEAGATNAGAADEFGGLVDEALWRLGKAAGPWAHRLMTAKGRVFASAERLDEAATVYQAAVEAFADDADVRALEALIDRSPATEWRQKHLRWLFQWRVARAKDPGPHLLEWAAVEEEQFSDLLAAVRLLERALGTNPKLVSAWRRLALLKVKSGDVEGGLEALAKIRELGGSADDGIELDACEILISRLEQPEGALGLLDAALSRNPDDERARTLAHQALLAVARVAGESGTDERTWQDIETLAVKLRDPELALKSYGLALEGELEPATAEMLGRRLLAFSEQHLESQKLASGMLERVAMLAPNARGVFDRVKLQIIAEQRWPALFDLYERAVALASGERERAELLSEAAIAARDVADDAERAILFFERYLTLKSDDTRADAALERLYERVLGLGRERSGDAGSVSPEVATRAIAFLRDRYSKLGRDLELSKVLEIDLAHQADPRARVALLTELAALREHQLEDALGACESLAALLLLSPKDGAAQLKLFEMSQMLGADPRLVEVHSALLEASAEPAVRLLAARSLDSLLAELWRPRERASVLLALAELEPSAASRLQALRSAGRVYLEELSDAEHAKAVYQKLLERDPSDHEGHDGLVQALRVLESFAELAEALTARGHYSPRADARRDLAEAARLFAETLRDNGRAAQIWREIRTNFGGDTQSFEALSRLLRAQAEYGELAQLVAEEAEAQDSPTLYATLAELHREHTGDRAAAVSAYIRAGDFRAAGELFAASGELIVDDPGLSLELARTLEDRGHGDRAEQVLRRQLDHYGSRHPRERRQVEVDLAKLLQRVGRSADAFALLVPVAELYPSDVEVLYLLAGFALELGEFDRAEQSYRGLLLVLHRQESAEAGPSRAEIYVELSEIAARRGQGDRAEDLVASAFEAAQSPRDTLRALAKLVERRGHRNALGGEFKEQMLEIAGRVGQSLAEGAETEGAFEEWLGLLSIYDRLGEPAKASAFLDTLIESGQRELAAAKAKRNTTLADQLGLGLGALLERAGRVAEALEVYHSLALRAAPRRDALKAIVRLEEVAGDTGKLADALEQLLKYEHGPELVTLAARLVSLREKQGDEPARERALAIGAAADPSRADFRDELLAVYLERKDFQSAVALLERASVAAPADVVLRLRLAEAQRALGDAAAAVKTLDSIPASKRGSQVLRERWQALAAAGREEQALVELEAAYAADARLAPELIAALERVEAESSSEERALRLFDLYAANGETEKARASLERCLERLPKSAQARGRLAKLAAEQGDLARAKEHYRHVARELLAGADTVELLFDAAKLLHGERETPAALEAATKLVSVDPDHGEGVLLLADLLSNQGRSAEALKALAEYAASKPRKPGKLLSRVQKRIAQLRLAADELAEARQALGEAHQLDKTDLDVALLLGLVAMDLDDFDTAGAALRIVVSGLEREARGDAAAKASALSNAFFHLAWIDHGKGKKTSARRQAQRAVEQNPQNRDAQRLLRELSA